MADLKPIVTKSKPDPVLDTQSTEPLPGTRAEPAPESPTEVVRMIDDSQDIEQQKAQFQTECLAAAAKMGGSINIETTSTRDSFRAVLRKL